ncbi:MAG: alpha/beta hydrolase family protein, partial [Candidatus Caldatribacteriaceae bacterium]
MPRWPSTPRAKSLAFIFFPLPPENTPLHRTSDQNQFTERDVTFGIPGWELPGTVTIPKGNRPFPALLLVHGSGPNDRDETILGNKPFRDLAWGLATQGIAVFRYDKRTYVHGMKLTSLEMTHFTVEEEVFLDTLKALEFLR